MQNNSHTEDSRGFKFFKWDNDYQLSYNCPESRQVYNITKEKNRSGLKVFVIDIRMDGGQRSHCFHLNFECDPKLKPEDDHIWHAVNLFVDDLISWTGKDRANFHLIRQFLIDAQLIVKNFLGIEDPNKGWTNTLPDQLLVLQSLIQFLETSPLSIPELKDVAKDLIQSYYILAWEDSGQEEEIEHKQRAAEKYLRLCIDDSNQEWFDLGSKARSKKGRKIREDEVTGIAKKLIEKDCKVDSRRKRWLLQKAQSWLLSRYNLRKASEIAFNGKPKCQRWAFLALPECLAAIVLLWLSAGPFQALCLLDRNWVLSFFYLAGIAVVGKWILGLSCGKKENFLDNDVGLFLPRLAAGIVVGYLVLSGNGAWRDIFSNVLSYDWQLIILPLLGVFFYMYVEISKMTGHKIGANPAHILLRGYSYSVLTGVIVSDLFGESMAAHPGYALAVPVFHGVFGSIYPKVIFYHAPLALFIGVFLQLLWEDKPLTEKI